MKGYQRLDKKLERIATMQFIEFHQYKKNQLKNYKIQTKAMVDVCRDIDSLKGFINIIKEQLVDFDRSVNNKFEDVRDFLETKIKELNKKFIAFRDETKT